MTANAIRRSLDIRVAALAGRFGGRLPNCLIAAPVFLILCVATALIVMMTASADIRAVQRQKLDEVSRWRKAAVLALDAANATISGTPCTAPFQQQLRTIAFWPDGINEFLFMSETKALCSAVVQSFPSPVDLGQPDIVSPTTATDIWLERDLTGFGLSGMRGTILKKGRFAAIISNVAAAAILPPWLTSEFVALKEEATILPISGSPNLFASLRAGDDQSRTSLRSHLTCSDDGLFCVAAAIDAMTWSSHHVTHLLIGLVIVALSAYLIAFVIGDEIRRYFSFKSTMVRNLVPENIVLAYQPIYDLSEKKISGVEALVRYRDLDGTILYPDKFIDLVSDAGKTLELTRIVIETAREELGRYWTSGTDLQVNVNIFPRDLGSPELLQICSSFVKDANPHLKLAVEVVESEEVDQENFSAMVEKFHELGIKIYIDDFGSGYSSVETISTLPVDGIKLERSFAMAPQTSVMGRMFLKVIELLKTTGKPLIVEGIEDPATMVQLLKSDLARFAQGYCIGRPMPVEAFIKLVAAPDAWAAELAA